MADRNLYDVLGVSRTASENDIRKAYREIARTSHPDRNPGDKRAEDRFKEASYAKEVLLNKNKRRLYDEFGAAGLREGFDANAYRAYAGARRGGGRAGAGANLEDLLENMRSGRAGGGWSGGFQDFVGPNVVDSIFGKNRTPGGAQRSKRDLVSDITVSFVESVRGVEKELVFNPPGEGHKERVLRVRIPAGVTPGGRVRLRGQGADGGDLVLHVHVEPHPFFTRSNDDLHLQLPVTVGEAYHGARIPVPTPDGEVILTIPAGIQSGAKLRLRGKGVARANQTGDLIVTVEVRMPDQRSDEVAGLIEALGRYYTQAPRSGMKF